MIRRPRSLRARILWSLSLLSGLYTVLLLAFLLTTYEAGQESAAQKLLVEEALAFQRAVRADSSAPPPQSDVLHTYLGVEAMPARYRDNLQRFEDEDYAIPLKEWNEIQLWQGRIPGLDQEVFMVLDLGATSDAEIFGPNLGRALLVSGAVFFGFSLWISWLVSNRLSRPLAEFTRQIERYDPAAAPISLERRFADGELGVLARSFAALHQRIQHFVDREQQFTRNASHELRTPITVIRGAREVLSRALPEPTPVVRRALRNIESSAEEMGASVETFLWLAREEAAPSVVDACPTAAIVRRCVDQHRGYLRDRDVDVELDLRCQTHARLSPHLFRIVVSNLVRNAFQHTRRGAVRIVLDEGGLAVEDAGPGVPPEIVAEIGRPHLTSADGTGQGLGLSIVHRIARRCGWRFDIRPLPAGGARAEIRFSGGAAKDPAEE